MRIPTTVLEVMTMLKAMPDSDKPSALNPSLTITQGRDIMINAIKSRKEDFRNTTRDILTLTNALAVIHDRKTRGIRPAVRKALAG